MSKRILFVNDEAASRRMAAACFGQCGCAVWTAGNATEALQFSNSLRFDVVVLDTCLAGESGAALINFLKPDQPEASFIFYTGEENAPESIRRLMKLGACAYVRKPAVQELLWVVSDMAGQPSRFFHTPAALAGFSCAAAET